MLRSPFRFSVSAKNHLKFSTIACVEPTFSFDEESKTDGAIENFADQADVQWPKRPPPNVTVENQHSWIVSKVNPFISVPYIEQLRWKYRQHREILLSLSDAIGRRLPISSILPCEYGPVVPSPKIYGYRNKDNFHVGIGVDGYAKTVGQIVGSSSRQEVFTVPTESLVSSPMRHKEVLRGVQDFMNKFEAPADFNRKKFLWQDGFVRSNRAGDVALTICLNPKRLSKSDIERAKSELIEYFSNGAGSSVGLHSLHIKVSAFSCYGREPFQLVLGSEHLVEKLLGRKFFISPDAFFQVNPNGAEVLYSVVRELASMNLSSPLSSSPKRTILLDACCGTGTIGLLLSDLFDVVVGFDAEEAAIADARKNAQLNDIKNAYYFSGPAKSCLKYMRSRKILPSDNDDGDMQTTVVAVVNPSRSGLSDGVMKELRCIPAVKRIVYVSCNPGGRCLNNFSLLCRSERHRPNLNESGNNSGDDTTTQTLLSLGSPFTPVKAVSVDMFPHTHHCEMVITFDRN